MSSYAAYVAPPSPGPHEGKRLSPWRVALGVLVVAAIAAGTVFGVRLFTEEEAAQAQTEDPWFAPYVDVTATPPYPFESPQKASQRDVVLSFVVAGDDACAPSWGAAYTMDEAARDLDLDRRIERLRQQDGDVLVSFGGAANTELATSCLDDDRLAKAYASVVDRYDVSTIDLDIEGDDLSDRVAGMRRAVAIAQLQSQRRERGEALAVWLTLPVALDGLTADGERAVAQMIDAGVDLAGVDVMTMDYGVDLEGASMGDAAIAASTATHAQLVDLYRKAGLPISDAAAWSKLGATPMIGQNGVVSEVFTLDDASQLNAFARQKELGRLSMWSLARDRECGSNYPDESVVSGSCSGVDQEDAAFAGALSRGFGGAPDVAAPTAAPEPSLGPARTPTDDPATSPYPIWDPSATYLAGSKVVRGGSVYAAKWWTRGDLPDDPLADADGWPWTLVGPVLPGERPYPRATPPPGMFPEWTAADAYEAGERVVFQGVPYEAKWWTQGDSPAAVTADPGGSPWLPLTYKQIEELAGGLASSAAGQ